MHQSIEVNAKMAGLTRTPSVLQVTSMAHLDSTIETPMAYSSTMATPMGTERK